MRGSSAQLSKRFHYCSKSAIGAPLRPRHAMRLERLACLHDRFRSLFVFRVDLDHSPTKRHGAFKQSELDQIGEQELRPFRGHNGLREHRRERNHFRLALDKEEVEDTMESE